MKYKKRRLVPILLAGLTTAAIIFAPAAGASAEKKNVTLTYRDIRINIDGKAFTPKDTTGAPAEPFIYNGTTYLPLRCVADAVGYYVRWDAPTNTVRLENIMFYIKRNSHRYGLMDFPISDQGMNGTPMDPLKVGETFSQNIAEGDGSGGARSYRLKISMKKVITGAELYKQFPDIDSLNGKPPAGKEYLAVLFFIQNEKTEMSSNVLPVTADQFCYVTDEYYIKESRNIRLTQPPLYKNLAPGESTEGYVAFLVNQGEEMSFILYNGIMWFRIYR